MATVAKCRREDHAALLAVSRPLAALDDWQQLVNRPLPDEGACLQLGIGVLHGPLVEQLGELALVPRAEVSQCVTSDLAHIVPEGNSTALPYGARNPSEVTLVVAERPAA